MGRRSAKFVGTEPPPVHQRPRCACCRKPLKPTINLKINWDDRSGDSDTKEWTGGYSAYGHFCTLRCGVRWANEVIDGERSA